MGAIQCCGADAAMSPPLLLPELYDIQYPPLPHHPGYISLVHYPAYNTSIMSSYISPHHNLHRAFNILLSQNSIIKSGNAFLIRYQLISVFSMSFKMILEIKNKECLSTMHLPYMLLPMRLAHTSLGGAIHWENVDICLPCAVNHLQNLAMGLRRSCRRSTSSPSNPPAPLSPSGQEKGEVSTIHVHSIHLMSSYIKS